MRKKYAGSLTVEAVYIVPIVWLTVAAGIIILFYFHDKNIISSCAYETAVIGSTMERNGGEELAEELESAFQERIGDKCIFFGSIYAEVTVKETEVEVRARAARKGIKVQVIHRAAVTEPEEKIRDIRRITG